MCGIIGIFSQKSVVGELHDGLIHLQHRGQDAAGMCTFDKKFNTVKGTGYVRDIFKQDNLATLTGSWGIGHTRYATVGLKGARTGGEDAQPFSVPSPYGIVMAHNGDLTNYFELREELKLKDKRRCDSGCDVEAILNVFASKLRNLDDEMDLFDQICIAVESVFDRCEGAYSVIAMIAGKGMLAFRDPHGIRPLACGLRKNKNGKKDYIFSSENTMYYPLGFEYMGDVQPGEVVYINEKGEMQSRIVRKDTFTPCVFEYVYLARPDSMINHISVYRARLRMGQNLAKQWKKKHPKVKPDVVIPVPFSSNTAALSMAYELGVRYSEGLYKNVFIGRTFIMPGEKERRKSILLKLSPQEIEIKGKNVLLVDDSIVRGTTSKEVVQLVRDAGAKKVYFASACPPVKFPDFYGIDIPTRKELIAANKTEKQIQKYIGADILMYQEIDDLVEAVTRKGKHNIDRLSMPYLDGWYVTGNITKKRMAELEKAKARN